jgi:4a-hydroxytetrahydrobiopterin dehydratase
MKDLTQIHCVQVTANTPRLADPEINQFLADAQGWKKYQKEEEPRLEKTFKFNDFNQAAAFTSEVAQIASEEDHHPVILTEWGKVTVTWWTHKIKGLHLNDFIMAAKTDQLYQKEK